MFRSNGLDASKVKAQHVLRMVQDGAGGESSRFLRTRQVLRHVADAETVAGVENVAVVNVCTITLIISNFQKSLKLSR